MLVPGEKDPSATPHPQISDDESRALRLIEEKNQNLSHSSEDTIARRHLVAYGRCRRGSMELTIQQDHSGTVILIRRRATIGFL